MASVDDLLGRIHRQAADLRPTRQPGRQLEAHLRAWIPLATNARRVLEALDPRPDQDPDFYGLLQSLSLGRATNQGKEPDPSLSALALTVGALGDVVASSPLVVAAAGQAQRSRLQASIRAALHAAARATFDIARAAGNQNAAVVVWKVAEATEPAALLPQRARRSTLEGLTITRPATDTVDGAVQLWLGAAQRMFTSYHLITGIALQEAAATLALLTQSTAEVLRDAVRRQIIEGDSGREAAQLLSTASRAWRHAATWPSDVQLGGRAYEHHQAVKAVRDTLTGPPLARLTLREKTHTLRAAVSTAATIGKMQASAVTWLVNRGGLWVAHERANLRPPGIERRHVKLDWETMPWDHPAARPLTDRAQEARAALETATEAIEHAVLPAARAKSGAVHLALLDNRIVVDRWETVERCPHAGRADDRVPRIVSRPQSGIPR